MTLRNIAVALALGIAMAAAVLALLDIPSGRGGSDVRASLFLTAGVLAIAAIVSLLFTETAAQARPRRRKRVNADGIVVTDWYVPGVGSGFASGDGGFFDGGSGGADGGGCGDGGGGGGE